MAAAHGAVRTGGSWASSGGFEVLGRVGTGSDGLLQFGNGGGRLGSGGTQVGHRVRRVRAPLSVTTHVKGAAIGKLQRHGASRTGFHQFPCEQAIPFYQQATNPFRGYRKHLTDNTFDDRNAAHKRLSVYYRAGVSIMETGLFLSCRFNSWSTLIPCKKNLASIICCFKRQITFPSRY